MLLSGGTNARQVPNLDLASNPCMLGYIIMGSLIPRGKKKKKKKKKNEQTSAVTATRYYCIVWLHLVVDKDIVYV